MKKTIKEDRQRKVIKEELLNDNLILEYTQEKDKIIVGVRFVDSPISGIKEHILATYDVAEYTEHIGELIQISEDKSAVALFKPIEGGYQLYRVYDTEEHSSEVDDFIDIVYDKKFPHQPLNKQLVKKKM